MVNSYKRSGDGFLHSSLNSICLLFSSIRMFGSEDTEFAILLDTEKGRISGLVLMYNIDGWLNSDTEDELGPAEDDEDEEEGKGDDNLSEVLDVLCDDLLALQMQISLCRSLV